jgi:hypothetical protein
MTGALRPFTVNDGHVRLGGGSVSASISSELAKIAGAPSRAARPESRKATFSLQLGAARSGRSSDSSQPRVPLERLGAVSPRGPPGRT